MMDANNPHDAGYLLPRELWYYSILTGHADFSINNTLNPKPKKLARCSHVGRRVGRAVIGVVARHVKFKV